VGVVIFLLAFEAASRLSAVDPRYVPPASVILLESIRALGTSAFWINLLATLKSWAIGLAAAIVIAVPVGIAFGIWDRAYRATRIVVEFMRPVPAVALIPPAILIFGQGTEMKTVLVVWASIWPILFNTMYGMHSADPVSIETARSFGFGSAAILLHVRLPRAAPFIATGISISAAIALVVVISTEFLAGGEFGLGAWLLASSFDPETFNLVWAGTLLSGVVGIAIALGIQAIERRMLPWHFAREAETA
jgi:NitT/TauT family transport system permease protein